MLLAHQVLSSLTRPAFCGSPQSGTVRKAGRKRVSGPAATLATAGSVAPRRMPSEPVAGASRPCSVAEPSSCTVSGSQDGAGSCSVAQVSVGLHPGCPSSRSRCSSASNPKLYTLDPQQPIVG